MDGTSDASNEKEALTSVRYRPFPGTPCTQLRRSITRHNIALRL